MNGLTLLPTRLCEAYLERRRTTPRKQILLDIEEAIFQLIDSGYQFPIQFSPMGSEANQRRIERHLTVFENESALTPERMRFFWCFYPALIKALPQELRLRVIEESFGSLGIGVYAAFQPQRADLINLVKSLNNSVTQINADLLDGNDSAIAHLARMRTAINQFSTGASV